MSRIASVTMLAILTGPMLAPVLAATGVAPDKPSRIVSTNVCTDQLALLLAERDRIASLSNLSQDPNLSTMPAAAKGIAQNGARAEEIVPLKPDLVLANAWTGAKANRFLAGLGIKVLVVPDATSFDGIALAIRIVGDAVGEPAKAESVIADMRAKLAAARKPQSGKMALIYEPNGYTPSKGSLSDEVLTHAGYTNLAPHLGVETYGAVALERVVASKPDLIVFDDHSPSQSSRAQAILHHPALKRIVAHARQVWMPSKLWLCAGPWTVDAVAQLAETHGRR